VSLTDNVARYYAERAPVYDETAGYTDPEAERLRTPIKDRYRKMFQGRTVLEIACGSGYWTQVIGEAAASVLAVDINESLIEIARDRCRHMSNIDFQIADAYTLEGVPTGFSAAFSVWWWSHVPKARLQSFLKALHGKLHPGAQVMFRDQLLYGGYRRRQDADGNTLEERILPDGRSFEIVKNFTSESEIQAVLAGLAASVEYLGRPDEESWEVTYLAT